MPLNVGDRYWVPHEEQSFLPAAFKAIQGDKAVFTCDGEDLSCPTKDTDGLARVIDAQLEGVDNICTLEEVTQASCLFTVKTRYLKKDPKVYTRVAKIMIALNPFQALPIYGPGTMRTYLQSTDPMELDPHLFAIGWDAVKSLQEPHKPNQAVLISGESGAGKTESTKLVLSYVSEALSGGAQGGIQDKIMRTNPILESFGNAMTVRNNNSSRFGKWLQMTVEAQGNKVAILGCSVVDFLLELTRVCKQGEKERNYHVFFQMLYQKERFKDAIKIGDPSSYRYIKDSLHIAPSIDDKQFFDEHVEAYDTLGFEKSTQMEIFKMVMGILTLGNAEFKEVNDVAVCVDETPVVDAAKMFGIPADVLKKMVLVRILKVGKDVTEAGRTPAQAEQARDGLGRLIYGRLFKYLIERINSTLRESATDAGQYFGILDIAGFESFEKNSIEQLFINLSNEHLQAHFNNHIFKMELDDYKAEGIDGAGGLNYQANDDIIALIDSKVSILATLDEEIIVPKATDMTFHGKLLKNFEKHPRFIKPKFSNAGNFGISHFAGPVTYEVAGFLDKNVDKPPDESADVFKTSSFGVLNAIGQKIADELAEASAPGKKKAKTVASTFRASLEALIAKLSKADPHFIRCIKPNQQKVPNKFSPPIVMDQLNCSGVFEAVRIRQSGYASRVPYKDFLVRYRTILPKNVLNEIRGKPDPDGVQLMVKALPDALSVVGDFDTKDVVIGKTKVFCRSRVIILLDKARDISLVDWITLIQKMWRGYAVRKMMKTVKGIFKELDNWMKANSFYGAPGASALAKHKTADAIEAEIERLKPIAEKARNLPVAMPKEKELEKLIHRMHQEAKLYREILENLKGLDALAINHVVTRAKDLELTDLPEVQTLKVRMTKLKTQLPLIEGMQNAIKGEDGEQFLDDCNEVLAEIEKNGLKGASDWLAELPGAKLLGELSALIGVLKEKHRLEEEAEKAAAEKATAEASAKAAAKAAEAEKKAAEAAAAHAAHEAAVAAHAAAAAAAAAAGAAAPPPPPPEPEPVPEVVEPPAEEAMKDSKSAAMVDVKSEKKKKEDERKSRKSTITGLSKDDETKILLDLMSAMETYDVAKLHENLGLAIKQGVKEESTMSEAQEMFSQLEMEDFLIEKIKEVCEDIQKKTGDQARNLKGVKNLMDQAIKLEVAAEAVAFAKGIREKAVRERARQTVKGKLFEEVDIEELNMVDAAFSDLSQFQGLKNPKTWKGHKAAWIFGSGDSGVDVMLKHNINPLKEAITKVGASFEGQSTEAFQSILGWMYNKSTPEVQRVNLSQEITTLAKTDPKLADEIFVQVMKQLTGNPLPRSVSAGWKLMLNLVQRVQPSPDLHEYVHVFIMKALSDSASNAEDRQTMEQCVADLNKTAHEEPEENDEQYPIQVMLMDHSHRKVLVHKDTKVEHLCEMVREQLKLAKTTVPQWTLFQCTEGHPGHRLVNSDHTMDAILSRWAKLKEQTGKATWFIFKRRVLKNKEILDASNPVHAKLTYLQALDDYLKYPLKEHLGWMTEVAGRILYLEKANFKKEMDEKRLHEPGVLEHFFPPVCLDKSNRKQLGEDIVTIMNQHPDIQNRLTMMSRLFALFQKLPLFGSQYWLGRQIFELDAQSVLKETINDEKYRHAQQHWMRKHGLTIDAKKMPSMHFAIDDDQKDQQFILVVDYHGIRFLRASQSDKVVSGQRWYRGFLFNEDTYERVLVWGAKGNLVQLIVSAVDPTSPGKDRVPQRINFQSPAAVDIAYALHATYQTRGQDVSGDK